ncbi:uroporphyrinogen decarboxylase family protein [Chloroflexota bacterium]
MAENKNSVEDQKLIDEIQKKHGKSIDELRLEREKRLWDAVELKVPDKVPVIFGGTFFACKYAGIPYSAAYYDHVAWKNAFKRMIVDMDPDSYGWEPRESGVALEALETNYTRWPGGTLPPDVPFQIAEKEYMQEDEYDLLLSNPNDYMLRYLLPRTYDALQPLANLPALMGFGAGVEPIARMFVSPEFEPVIKVMKKVGEAGVEREQILGTMTKDMESLGFAAPLPARGGVSPPFSSFSNTFRTFNGVVKDMYRQPEKLKAALQLMTDFRIARATPAVKREDGHPTLGSSGEAHRVSDEFFSNKQFEEFVWPFWKQAIDKTFELGYEIISMFFEGRRDNQLHYFTQFPKRSMLIRFAESDIFRAKEMLGDKACIMGNVPITMLQVGSPSEVEEYCKKLIEKVGKNGGFILRCSTDFTQEAKPENVKVMIDAAEKYGRYQ